jgi:predicted helicase
MQITTTQKRAIDHYYMELGAYHDHKVTHETAVRSAFQNLLAIYAQSANWILIPEQVLANGKRPDGTLRDSFNLPRGYWEAKDTKDDLLIEIRKKINAGYPVTNTIFEDTRRAVLYQNNKPVLEVDLTQPKNLTNVLDIFFHYAAPDIETFEHAVEDFKESIPDLAEGLLKRIKEEHAHNRAFVAAFSTFLDLCRTSMDPNMSSETVDEMLIQHLMTERLFRTVFNNTDFTRRNIIALEIEKVIQTLTSRAFNRSDFEKSTNRFYVAIENAARNLDDWTEKQHFLNTVYERFFQGFSIKQADTYGIIYTPQEIVDFMCASIEEVLRREFSTSIEEPGVQIIDPSAGTGSYIVNLLHRIPNHKLKYKYENDLFCNEIMLLPYYIASLNIEHEYYSQIGEYKPFEGICFADTLELAEKLHIERKYEIPSEPTYKPHIEKKSVMTQQNLFFVEENTERIQREKDAQIMVVIGNPPYNQKQKSENDNNRNRRYPVIDERIHETYMKDSKATSKLALTDPYVKFFRWATDRLGRRDGIVCFISNNSFFDQLAFDGMRKHLLKDFTNIYHIDLHGNIRKNPKLSGTTHNVFGIQVGVGITVAVRTSHTSKKALYYYRVPEYWNKKQKLDFLEEKGNITEIEWLELHPDERHTWLTEGLHSEFTTFLPVGSREVKASRVEEVGGMNTKTIFKTYSRGAETTRDNWMYDFDRGKLAAKVKSMIETYNAELSRWIRAGSPKTIDDFVLADETRIKWSSRLKECLLRKMEATFQNSAIRNAFYRPFTHKFLYFDNIMTHRQGVFPNIFPIPTTERENRVICMNGTGAIKPFHCLVVNGIPDLNFYADPVQCFPFYTYTEDGNNRRENITDWALSQFQAKYSLELTKWDIFHYVYSLLNHPQYLERYAENLKRDLPHIPLLHRIEAFLVCVNIGKQLMDVHLNYEQAEEYQLKWIENRDVPFSWRVEKMRLTLDKTAVIFNESLTLLGIPQECFQYRLGNRSALDWVIDQYQVSVDKRSGIVSDPNREDDPEYIVRLVGRVVTVSVETVKLVEELEREVKLEDWMGESVE